MRHSCHASLLPLLLSFASSSIADTRDETNVYPNKWAIVVGINYDHSPSLKLSNAENDARSVSELLQQSYNFQCEVLLGSEGKATREAIWNALERVNEKLQPDDCFLFYFAGHGELDQGASYLFPSDVEQEGKRRNFARLNAIDILQTKPKARHALYIFDSCHSGDILNWLRKVAGYESANQVQSLDVKQRSIQVLTSSASNQLAQDGAAQNSPFARALMRALSKNRATATELFEFIKKDTASDQQRPQFAHINPTSSSGNAGGDFHFVLTGEIPLSLTQNLVFQTLPGSYASLPGSPLARTWFDETPWLTPSMRLMLDDENEKQHKALYRGGAGPQDAAGAVSRLKETVRQQVESGLDESAAQVLQQLLAYDRSAEGSKELDELLSATTRSSQSSAENSHLQALLRSRFKSRDPEHSKQVEELFQRALGAYPPQQLGLRARCLADHGLWLLSEHQYPPARESYRHASRLIKDRIVSPSFQIELIAGEALACRHLAKNGEKHRWDEARKLYDRALETATKELSPSDLLAAYLHERRAWLHMDLWEVDAAAREFEQVIAIQSNRPADASPADIDSFLSIAHAKQGLAMAKLLQGHGGHSELQAIQESLLQRIADDDLGRESSASTGEALYERLCNATERLGDCDFLSGRAGMERALEEYVDRGLPAVDDFEDYTEPKKAQLQRLRLSAKAIIAATLMEDRDRLLYAKSRLPEATYEDRTCQLLLELAQAFAAYDRLSITAEAQGSLDAIRSIIHNQAVSGLDREPAELLMMVATVVSDEQRRLDARVLQGILPRRPEDRKSPQGAVQYVRDQFDRIIMLHGGGVDNLRGLEFERFTRLIYEARQSEPITRGPFVLFYFPRAGQNGLMLVRTGDSNSTGRVQELDFAAADVVEGLSKDRIARVNAKLAELRVPTTARLYWSDDQLVQLPESCPFELPKSTD